MEAVNIPLQTIQVTPTQAAFLESEERYRYFKGGRGSGKTFALCLDVIRHALSKDQYNACIVCHTDFVSWIFESITTMLDKSCAAHKKTAKGILIGKTRMIYIKELLKKKKQFSMVDFDCNCLDYIAYSDCEVIPEEVMTLFGKCTTPKTRVVFTANIAWGFLGWVDRIASERPGQIAQFEYKPEDIDLPLGFNRSNA